MIGYTTVGASDLERARAFYDAVLAPLGGRRTLTYERSQYYGGPDRGAMLGVVLPFDGQAASIGNGVMVALAACAVLCAASSCVLVGAGRPFLLPLPQVAGFSS